jgi:hypothetical protein
LHIKILASGSRVAAVARHELRWQNAATTVLFAIGHTTSLYQKRRRAPLAAAVQILFSKQTHFQMN